MCALAVGPGCPCFHCAGQRVCFVPWGAAGVGLACVMVLVKHALPGGLPARMVTSGANGWIHAWR